MATGEFEQAALEYLQRGWSVIPMRKRDKRPAIRWQNYQTVPASEQEVHDWFRRWPEDNVGIVTGAVSGLVVLDVDPRHGGADSLEKLEREHGPLPRTQEAITGGGGRHIYFAHPGGGVQNRVGIAPGIDLRGDGGCIVAPPSVHPSGNQYQWVTGCGPGQERLAPLPHWLQRVMSHAEQRAGHTPVYWCELLRDGVQQGERNNTIASLTGHLLWHGVDPDVALELMLCWNRIRCLPPLDDEEVARTVQSITRLHERQEEDE
jgi:hypothetical protein